MLQKRMMPILGEGGNGISYLRRSCPRKFVDLAAKEVARTEREAVGSAT